MAHDTGDGQRLTLRDEENYWQTLEVAFEEDAKMLEHEFFSRANIVHGRLTALDREKRELEMRILQVQQDVAREHDSLANLTYELRENRSRLSLQQDARRQQMQTYFANHRRMEDDNRAKIAAAALPTSRPGVEVVDLSQPSGAVNGDRPRSNGVGANGQQPGDAHKPAQNPGLMNHPDLTFVVDSAQQRIGGIKHVPLSGNDAKVIDRPPRRVVHLRRGVTFGQDDVRKLHQDREQYISAMVQATGDVRTQRQCAPCSRGEGPFATCVVVEGLADCANCLWTRNTCGTEDRAAEEQPPPPARHVKMSNSHDVQQHVRTNGAATPASLSRPTSRDKSTGWASTATDEAAGEESTPITRSNLILRHDGRVYTHPDCMRGVPVDKIHPNHPYWDPTWTPIEPNIESVLQGWRTKRTTALESSKTTSKFQPGRQVNRGETILKFLEDSDFHPFQLLSKKYMSPKLATYDTVFRLADTIRELGEFKTLDITPLEWLRQRLHELIVENGPEFRLANTIHNFYHDRKYEELRIANGKKSIGRPSGASRATPKESPVSINKKRKFFVSDGFPGLAVPPRPPATPTPTPTPAPVPKTLTQDETERSAPPTPEISRSAKKMKGRQGKPKDPDLSYEGHTDIDDYSRDSIGKHDWALNRIKHRLNSVGTGVTQYWHWIPDMGERVFEHQVLAEGDTFTWGIYAKPINFHLELEHIQEIRWGARTTKVMVVCSPHAVLSPEGKSRGDVLAEFKRARTKQRFLVFCQRQGVELVKVSSNEIEAAWNAYESPDVPAMADSEIHDG
ncbi:hypothetical protein CSOJ01_08044 [Colletotrichum sojae]|uniref:Uncharacterized protein n=1 Tax=Colletotrichum sojae TaxID=2175907 RepID=A0A8H6MTI6_9PEZI|nr:hypothetical protein CSOJ01_08044 [Colletotrichum sojae]